MNFQKNKIHQVYTTLISFTWLKVISFTFFPKKRDRHVKASWYNEGKMKMIGGKKSVPPIRRNKTKHWLVLVVTLIKLHTVCFLGEFYSFKNLEELHSWNQISIETIEISKHNNISNTMFKSNEALNMTWEFKCRYRYLKYSVSTLKLNLWFLINFCVDFWRS